MKRRLFNVIVVMLILGSISALYVYNLAGRWYSSERVIFSIDDPQGDDHGPGSYVYPWGSIFDPKKELLDLVRFRVLALKDQYCFDMTFPRVTNPFGAVEGFSHPIIEIYLSNGTTDGRIEPATEGSNVFFDADNPWNYLVKVVSFNGSAIFDADENQGGDWKKEGIKARLLSDKKTVRVMVPQKYLPGDPRDWRYYVLVGSQDGSGPDNFRVVNAVPDQLSLGGGTDTAFDPNVVDLLAPVDEQEKMLGSYSVENQKLAVIRPVGPAPKYNRPMEQFYAKVIEVFKMTGIKI